jgi:hypothetical protein
MAVNPFTGLDDGIGQLKNIVSGAGEAIDQFLPQDPASRAALMQIGLNLMQPQAMGQTLGGHIAQAIGSGGEAVSRGEKEDLERTKAEDKLTIAEERMQRQREVDAARAAQGDAVAQSRADRLELMRLSGQRGERSQERADKAQGIRDRAEIQKLIDAQVKEATDLVNPDPEFTGKSKSEVRRIITERVNKSLGAQDTTAPAGGGVAEVEQNGWVYDKNTGKALRKAR